MGIAGDFAKRKLFTKMTRSPHSKLLKIKSESLPPLSAILMKPKKVRACFVFAHGAGAGMSHHFMETIATGLYARGIATLRYQFPYMEKGSKRPDQPPIAKAAVRAAVSEARSHCRGRPLIAGGKSFGGRMTSQAQATEPLEGVDGLIFLGFPLHASGKPSVARAEHLLEIRVPMLFVQGTRDKLAELSLLRSVVQKIGVRATLCLVDEADHAFHVLARSGRTADDVMGGMLDALASWVFESIVASDSSQLSSKRDRFGLVGHRLLDH
jgi:hypothetical protein